MARKWYCSECGQSVRRRHDVERQDGRGHLDRFHRGQGQAVRWDQLPEDLRNLAIVRNSHEDSFPGQAHTDYREVGERISTFSAPRPHNNAIGKSPHSGDNNMSPKYYDGVGSGGYRSPINNAPSYERFAEKFWARFEDKAINYILRERVSMQPQDQLIDYNSSGEVYGYISHTCNRCNMWEPLEVFFTKTDNNNTEYRGHQCYNEALRMSVNGMLVKNVDTSGLLMDGGISLLSQFVKRKWARADGTIIMIALKAIKIVAKQKVAKEGIKEDEGELKINNNTFRLVCALPNFKKPEEQQAALSCDLVKECEFLVRPKDSSHWINRLLSDNSNAAIGNIRSEELVDFLTIAKGSTFAFVKVLEENPQKARQGQQEQQQGGNNNGTSAVDSSCYYLIALWDKDLFPQVIEEEKLPSNLAIKNDIQKNNVAARKNIWPPQNGFCMSCGKEKEAHAWFCPSCGNQ